MKNIRRIISIVVALSLMLVINLSAHAYSGYAYSMGGEFNSGQDVISACDYWALCGYSSFYTNNPTYSYVSSANRLNSDILYFSAHGNQNSIQLKNNIKVTDGYNNGIDEVGIKSYSLTNTKLVVYDACSTAAGTTNLCTETINSGANAVVGWRDEILDADAFKWQQRFQEYCSRGYKVHLAMDYADSFSDYIDNARIKNHLIYGDWLQTIKRTSASAANVLNESTICKELESCDNRLVKINQISCQFDDIDYDLLKKTIMKIDSGFDATSFEITVTPTNLDKTSFVVDYTYKLGEILTNSGYTVIFKDNKASTIYNNMLENAIEGTKNIRTSIDWTTKLIVNTKEAQNAANSKVENIAKGNRIIDQNSHPYYDAQTDKCYIAVSTKYDYMNSGHIGKTLLLYPLS